MTDHVEDRECGCRYVTKDTHEPGFVISSWTRLDPCAFHLEKYREDPRWVDSTVPGDEPDEVSRIEECGCRSFLLPGDEEYWAMEASCPHHMEMMNRWNEWFDKGD